VCIQRPMAIDIQAPAPRTLPSIQSTPLSEDRPSLPSLGFDISRPSSTSTQASSHYSQIRNGGNPTVQLPALSTLASIASIASTAPPAESSTNHGYVLFESATKMLPDARSVQTWTPVFFDAKAPANLKLPTSSLSVLTVITEHLILMQPHH
jgi:hypothetical protein